MINNSSCIDGTNLTISHSLQTNQVECDIDSIISGTLSNAENAPQALLEIILSQQEADGSHKHSGKELHEVLRIKETSTQISTLTSSSQGTVTFHATYFAVI